MADKTGYIGRNPADSSVVVAQQIFTPTGSQSSFTFSSGYTVGYLDVYVNGVRMVTGNDYNATDGSTITLTAAAGVGDIVEMLAYKAFNLATDKVGILSETVSMGTVKNLNFIGTGNTFLLNGDTMDITIEGVAGGRTYDLISSTSGSNVILTLDASTGDDDPILITAGSNITLTEDGSGTGFTIAAAGGSSGITVQDEGVSLSTLGTTLNFVGSGVVASGTGATKTITVSGGGGGGGAASQITVADESSDTTCFPVFTTAATGDLGPKSGSNLTFNSSTGNLGATLLTGTLQTAAQANITSVGTLGALLVSGNVGIGTDAPDQILHLESGHTKLKLKSTNTNTASSIIFDTTNITNADFLLGQLAGRWNGTDVAYINLESGSDTTNKDDGLIAFRTSAAGEEPPERMRIDSSGRVLVGTTSDVSPAGFNNRIQVNTNSYTASILLRRDSADDGAGNVIFAKSRSSSLGGHTIVQSGDDLGKIIYYGADGTDTNTPAASIEAAVDATPGTNDMPGRLIFKTTSDGASSSTERLRIDSSGNVSITDSPTTNASKLFIRANSGANAGKWSDSCIALYNTTGASEYSQMGFGYTVGTWAPSYIGYINTSASSHGMGDLVFGTRGAVTDIQPTERLRITSAGLVRVPNNGKFTAGAGDDLQIYHDGTDTFIDNDNGDLLIRNTGDDIIIRAADDVLIQTQGSEGAIIARGDGTVELYHNNVKKIETKATGIQVVGSLTGFEDLQGYYTGSTVTYTVTVAGKDVTHRYNGTGSGSGYKIDGAFAPWLTLTPGRTYRFDQSDNTNNNHPFRFYLEADRTTAYTTNVTTAGLPGQAGAYTQITVTDTTPQVLHYMCSQHAYMGNGVSTNSNYVSYTYGTISNSDIDIREREGGTTLGGGSGQSAQWVKMGPQVHLWGNVSCSAGTGGNTTVVALAILDTNLPAIVNNNRQPYGLCVGSPKFNAAGNFSNMVGCYAKGPSSSSSSAVREFALFAETQSGTTSLETTTKFCTVEDIGTCAFIFDIWYECAL